MAPKFIIEHMEEGFSDWVKLEYIQIAQDVGVENLWLSSVPENTAIPEEFSNIGIQYTNKDMLEDIEKSKICLLDPSAEQEFQPSDDEKFEYFLFGGILGDHPPRDRTGELRKKGYMGRHLGKTQMTTDTAVRVTKIVSDAKTPLDRINYVDFPELKFNKNESTEMPFRYVKDFNGQPILPKVSITDTHALYFSHTNKKKKKILGNV